MTKRTTNRRQGMVVHVGPSRSAKFWAAIKGTDGDVYFSYGRSYLGSEVPRVGQRVSFAAIPKIVGTKYPRAIEVAIMPHAGRLEAVHRDGAVRLVLRHRQSCRELGRINLKEN